MLHYHRWETDFLLAEVFLVSNECLLRVNFSSAVLNGYSRVYQSLNQFLRWADRLLVEDHSPIDVSQSCDNVQRITDDLQISVSVSCILYDTIDCIWKNVSSIEWFNRTFHRYG